MSDREKLIELLQESTGCRYCGDICVDEEIDIDDQEIARIADHLIANGVVVQKHGQWIKEEVVSLIPVEYDEQGLPVLHTYTCYRCNQCGRTKKEKVPYCNCGAKMREDGDEKRRTSND